MDNEAQGTINRRVAMHIIKRFSGWMTLAVFAVGGVMVAADPAFAKTDMDQLTIGGEARIRYEIRNNTSLNSNNSNESAASHRIRVNVGYDLTPDVSFFAQIQDARIWGSEGQSAANTNTSTGIGSVASANGDTTGVDLHQGYLLLKNVLVSGLSVKAGRQEIIFGDHRLFGNFGWSQVGNSFDAVVITHSMPIGDVDLFWARIADTETGAGCITAGFGSCSGVIFTGNNATGRGTATTDQDVYGLYVTLKAIPNWTVEPYLFLLKDGRTPTTAITAAQAAGQARSTVGGRINGKVGGLDATAEMAWQTGSISSGTAGAPANDVHINAWAGAFRAGYTMDVVPMKPRVGIEIDYASGDGCVAGAAAGAQCKAAGHFNTFDNLFPTNHGKFGYMELMAWKHQVTYQAVFDVKPSPVSKLQVNVAIMRLANRHDNWYRASQAVYGATGAGNNSSSIGRELDVHYWHTFKEKFKFEIGGGHFWAGTYITNGQNNINGGGQRSPNGSGQNWGYVMGSILF